MKGLNRAFLIGHIGQEPELRNTASGVTLLKLNLATPNARKVGEAWVETTDWHRITAFGKDAEYLSKYAHKGDPLAVECMIRPGKWQDKDNVTHYEVNLVVERVLWLGSPRGAHRPEGTERQEPARVMVQKPLAVAADEVPF